MEGSVGLQPVERLEFVAQVGGAERADHQTTGCYLPAEHAILGSA